MRNYKEFEKELRELCSKQKPATLKSKSKTTNILLQQKWSGILIRNSKWLKEFQRKVQNLINVHAVKKELHRFNPHISLVYGLDKPVDLTGIKPIKLPVTRFKFDRVTICKREKKSAESKIFKHMPLKQDFSSKPNPKIQPSQAV